MSDNSYHHGNLKNALIEAGIEMVNEMGCKNLSLRRVAAKCGVSNAAPYAHFSCKEEMIQAMQDYVTEKFMRRLKETIESMDDPYTEEGILRFGECYVCFFLENPNYFMFLFYQNPDSVPCMKVQLSLEEDQSGNFPPYEYFKEFMLQYNKRNGTILSVQEQEIQIIKLWVTVHGISSIATMKNVTWNESWKDKLKLLL